MNMKSEGFAKFLREYGKVCVGECSDTIYSKATRMWGLMSPSAKDKFRIKTCDGRCAHRRRTSRCALRVTRRSCNATQALEAWKWKVFSGVDKRRRPLRKRKSTAQCEKERQNRMHLSAVKQESPRPSMRHCKKLRKRRKPRRSHASHVMSVALPKTIRFKNSVISLLTMGSSREFHEEPIFEVKPTDLEETSDRSLRSLGDFPEYGPEFSPSCVPRRSPWTLAGNLIKPQEPLPGFVCEAIARQLTQWLQPEKLQVQNELPNISQRTCGTQTPWQWPSNSEAADDKANCPPPVKEPASNSSSDEESSVLTIGHCSIEGDSSEYDSDKPCYSGYYYRNLQKQGKWTPPVEEDPNADDSD